MGLLIFCKRFYKKCWKTGKRRRSRVEIRRVEIPEDVIVTLVLPKLPVKSLIRFKSVCKSWKSLISSPQFAKSHLSYSSSNSRQYLVLEDSQEWYSISCDGSTLKPAFLLGDHNNLFPDHGVVDVVGCCNGLMCMFVRKLGGCCKSYAIWNPATHEFRVIPLPDHHASCPSLYYCGFGYVPGLDDYIIFAAWRKPYIFSLRTGCWNEVKDKVPVEIGYMGFSQVGVCVGDSMYWYLPDTSDPSSKLIFGFHYATQEFKTKPIPCWVLDYDDARLYVIQGCLSLCCRHWEKQCRDVWIMTQLGDSGSWKRSFGVPLAGRVRLVNFSIPGKCCVLDRIDHKLKLLDSSAPNNNIDLRGLGGIEIKGYPCYSTYYFPSLISPFGTTSSSCVRPPYRMRPYRKLLLKVVKGLIV